MVQLRRIQFGLTFVFALAASAATASAQLRVATWNITFYAGGRATDIQSSVYGIFNGRSMSPDVILLQEFTTATAVPAFVTILNGAPGSPGDWAGAPFIDGPDTDSAFVYRTSKVEFLGVTVVAVGGVAPNHPRNIQRYDVRLKGYTGAGAVLASYSTHMKSGSTGDDQARRLVEAQRIRDDAELLTPAWQFLVGGDFNIQSSSQSAYQELVGSQANNAGRFFDPINTPGSWNNNIAFRFVHTQDPIGAGGMDDRHDQILVEGTLIDGVGFDYVGNPAIPYSTTTWDDPNHSYRAWGNDGTSYNSTLTVAGNAMVGATIAQDLIDSTGGAAGHLPAFLDFRVPAKIDSQTVLDFGSVPQGSTAEQVLTVLNSANTTLWTAAGIANLNYTLSATAGFSAPGGAFSDAPGGAGNDHTIAMDTSTPGPKNGTLSIASDSVDEPVRVVTLIGTVVPSCNACDVNCDTFVNSADAAELVDMLVNGTAPCSACAGDTVDDDVPNGVDIAGLVGCLLAP
ncbi:MAG: hypothetical protein L6Q92_04235 [Phycisphaerae bacterium]|nr:hypothetical protein [Phycisphaerae bacterium]